MSVGAVTAAVRPPVSDQMDAETSRLVKLARKHGIDPGPLTDIDHGRRRHMADLMWDVDTARQLRGSGTSKLQYAQQRWDERANSDLAYVFGGLVASAAVGGVGTMLMTGVEGMSRWGAAALIGAMGAALIGVPILGIHSDRAERRSALERAKADEARLNDRDKQSLRDAVEAAKAYAAEVRASPTEPVQ